MKPKLSTFLLVIFPLLLASCARTFNSGMQKVVIETDKHVQVLNAGPLAPTDSFDLRQRHIKTYYVPRSPKPLIITIATDSMQKQVVLPSQNSLAYWYNIAANYGIGMLADKDHPKRYGYPAHNYITVNDTDVVIRRYAPEEKGAFYLSLGIPYLQSFHMRQPDGRYSSSGIFGLEAGVEYYYRPDRFLSLNLGTGMDKVGEYIGTGYYQSGMTGYASLRHNHVTGNFEWGYGLNYSQLIWGRHTYGDTIKIEQSYRNHLIGFSLAAHYRLGRFIRMGMSYEPGFLRLSPVKQIDYQHHISLQIVWKLPLRRLYR